jgi:hypothetical protein
MVLDESADWDNSMTKQRTRIDMRDFLKKNPIP